ncbi:MAG: dihydrolipoyl dehydrogenase [Lentisphaerae bacterium]|nr:dihydrolipoyl dehydrogenase [Lentisphaerota bacterium]
MEKFDVVVIGAGPGGYPAAIRAAQTGARVAVVEKEAVGGTCLNWGCIPTKALIASAEQYWRMKHCGALGLSAADVGFDYAAMAKRKDEVVARLTGGVGQLLKANGVTALAGTASFESRNRVAVKPAGRGEKRTVETANTIIATGSVSAMPGFIPRHPRIVESRAFLDLKKLPAALIVLGGGVIGCEFACLAAQLGTRVTVVELLEDILIMLDADVRREVKRHMTASLGIEILAGAALKDIAADRDGVRGTAGDRTVQAEMMLVSVGRLPLTEGLELKRIGLETNERGFIATDEGGRTALATVYAVGDVTAGSTQLAHAATSQGIVAAENICLGGRKKTDRLVPACIFTSPEIGSVGLTEGEAGRKGRAVKVGKFAFTGLGKALASGEPEGFVKWVVDAQTDQLLGAHAVGAHATDLIAEAAAAIKAELTAEEIGRTIHCHPTFAEAWMEAAHAAHGRCIHAAPKRK